MSIGTGILAGLASGGLSNLMSEWHADKQQAREKELMDYQNSLNKANALDAYRMSTQGMKMAGLNPAIAQDVKPIAPEVSKGSVSQGENVEFDPQTMLLMAQAENLDAQTEKTKAETAKIEGVDTANVKADTDLKVANTLLTGSEKGLTEAKTALTGAEKGLTEAKTRTEGYRPNQVYAESEKTYAEIPKVGAETGKVKVDARRISQLNEQYSDANNALKKTGKDVAKAIMNSDAFANFDENTKVYFRKVADGSLPLTVGALDAINSLVNANDNIRGKDKEATSYQLAKDVLHEQIADSGVRTALAKLPKQTAAKLDAELAKFENEIAAIAVRTTSENQDVMLKEIEKKAKALQFAIDNIQPEAWASRGEDWEYFKSLGRHFTEHPGELLMPLGIFRGATGLSEFKKKPEASKKSSVSPLPDTPWIMMQQPPGWTPPTEPGVQSFKRKKRR